LNGGVHYFFYTSIMAQMDDLASRSLNNPAHDVDRRVVSVEQTGCSDNANFVLGFIRLRGGVTSKIWLLFGFSGNGGAHEKSDFERQN
jgi:hypothetical protein